MGEILKAIETAEKIYEAMCAEQRAHLLDIWDPLRAGELDMLNDMGLLRVDDIRYAVAQKWLTLDTAAEWYKVLQGNEPAEIFG